MVDVWREHVRIFLSYRREKTRWARGPAVRRARREVRRRERHRRRHDRSGHRLRRSTTRAAGCDALIAADRPQLADGDRRRGVAGSTFPEDFVRLELEAALERDVVLIPAFVQGAAARSRPSPRLARSARSSSRSRAERRRLARRREASDRADSRANGHPSRSLRGDADPPPSWRRRLRCSRSRRPRSWSGGEGDGNGGTTTATGPVFNAAQQTLLASIPPITRSTCDQNEQEPAARASVGCSGAGLSSPITSLRASPISTVGTSSSASFRRSAPEPEDLHAAGLSRRHTPAGRTGSTTAVLRRFERRVVSA